MPQPERVIQLVRGVLADTLVGAYLHGSAVLGGLRPDSDLDVLVVVAKPITGTERRTLVEGLLAISGRRAYCGPARPVELTVVVREDVVPWRFPPRCDFQYGEWLRDDYERGMTPQPETSPDLALLVTMVLRGDTTLLGPRPGDVLHPVPPADVARAAVAGIPRLLADLESDTRNVLLTLARIWQTLGTGDITPKDVAAVWVMRHLPARPGDALSRARAAYLGETPDRWTGREMDAARTAAEIMVLEIRKLTGG